MCSNYLLDEKVKYIEEINIIFVQVREIIAKMHLLKESFQNALLASSTDAKLFFLEASTSLLGEIFNCLSDVYWGFFPLTHSNG